MTLSIDDWDGSTNTDHETESPSADDVARAINALDGKRHTSVSLTHGSAVLTASGGNDERFIVTVAINVDEEFYNLINPDIKGDKAIDVVTGRQSGSFASKYVVDRKNALQAALAFVKSGKVDRSRHWEHQTD